MEYNELRDYDDLFEQVAEWMGLKWTKCMIKRGLREAFPGVSLRVMSYVMYRARKLICEKYGIDPQYYKGTQISFYESVMRSKEKMHDKLTAAERLDKLFSLEQISGDDPDVIAQKIRKALVAMDESVPDESDSLENEEDNNETETDTKNGESDSREDSVDGGKGDIESKQLSPTNPEDEIFADIPDDNIPPEFTEGLKFNKDDKNSKPLIDKNIIKED